MNLKKTLKLLAVPLALSPLTSLAEEPVPAAEHVVCRLGNAKGPMKVHKCPDPPKEPRHAPEPSPDLLAAKGPRR
jgi:hypothetical protein